MNLLKIGSLVILMLIFSCIEKKMIGKKVKKHSLQIKKNRRK